jgi:response regulator of citrate/malate metabolism
MILILWNRSYVVKRSKVTEQQIAFVLKQAELCSSVGEVSRKLGISTFSHCLDYMRMLVVQQIVELDISYTHDSRLLRKHGDLPTHANSH